MFNFSMYEAVELKRVKKAAETLLYYGYGSGLYDMVLGIDADLRRRESARGNDRAAH